jgi:hypothetical protein
VIGNKLTGESKERHFAGFEGFRTLLTRDSGIDTSEVIQL